MVSRALVKRSWGKAFCPLNSLSFKFSILGIECLFFFYCLSYRIQLAVNVQIPIDLGGLGGKAVYIG